MPGKWPHICLSPGHGLKEAAEGPAASEEHRGLGVGRGVDVRGETRSQWRAPRLGGRQMSGKGDSMMTEEGVGLEMRQETQGRAAGT